MKVSARPRFRSLYAPLIVTVVCGPAFSIVKDPVFLTSDAPKSKYEKLENRISKSNFHLIFFFRELRVLMLTTSVQMNLKPC